MRKPGIITALLLLFFSVSRSGKMDPVAKEISRNYRFADSLYRLENPTDQTDAEARRIFESVIRIYRDSSRAPDTFLFNCMWKRGVLEEVIGNYENAKAGYLGALDLAPKIQGFIDSLNFKPLLYAGAIYYRNGQFDSTRQLLEKAEALANKYSLTVEVERLYNTLGALYFEGGNFLQSKNYLEKALQLIEKNPAADSVEKVNFKLNIATAQVKLEKYDEALNSYLSLLQTHQFTDTIYLNIGNIYMSLGQFQEALRYFHYSRNLSHAPGLLNEIADAHLMLKQYDSALFYLNASENIMNETGHSTNARIAGLFHIYKGDYLNAVGQPFLAIRQYQNAIVSLEHEFTDTSLYSNPINFWGTFSSYMLFRALIKKASTFEIMYKATADIQYEFAALSAYLSAIDLATYLERSMDTDEARIFLKKNNNKAYHKAVDIAVSLYHITGKDSLLWTAFSIAERNKSSVLVANLQEFSVKSRSRVPDSLLQKERNLKYKIARLQVKADQAPDSINGTELTLEKRNTELDLSFLQKKIRKFLNPQDIQGYGEFPSRAEFQQTRISDDQALLDLYFTDSILHVFAITKNEISHFSLKTNRLDWPHIKALQRSLYDMEDGQQHLYETVSTGLFSDLVEPVFELLKNKKEWIVLPDGAFYFLPFEILRNPATEKMLIEDYTISYNVSTEFMSAHSGANSKEGNESLLAMAPFDNQGLYLPNDSNSLDQLPATAMEVESLRGKILMDSAATKASFMQNANNYGILHLATHAVMNTEKPSQSFIAFFPTNAMKPESFKLYLNELYGLNLDSTKLMILSACETGIGKFVQGEGVMSLSRGVLYAGCPSVITTLWRADDKATAFIINKFHENLRKGDDISSALRQAKLEFMKKFPSTVKNPSLWAHLILVGQVDPLYKSYTGTWLIVGLGILGLTGILAIYLLKRSRKTK